MGRRGEEGDRGERGQRDVRSGKTRELYSLSKEVERQREGRGGEEEYLDEGLPRE